MGSTGTYVVSCMQEGIWSFLTVCTRYLPVSGSVMHCRVHGAPCHVNDKHAEECAVRPLPSLAKLSRQGFWNEETFDRVCVYSRKNGDLFSCNLSGHWFEEIRSQKEGIPFALNIADFEPVQEFLPSVSNTQIPIPRKSLNQRNQRNQPQSHSSH